MADDQTFRSRGRRTVVQPEYDDNDEELEGLGGSSNVSEVNISPVVDNRFVAALSQRVTENTKFESLDCEPCHNEIWRTEYDHIEHYQKYAEALRWILYIIIGVCTAFLNEGLIVALRFAYNFRKHVVSNMSTQLVKYVLSLTASISFATFAALLCILEPTIVGSGYIQVKGFLNGIRLTNVFGFTALLAKMFGIFFSDLGGIVGSKGESIIYLGACVASTIWSLLNLFPPYDVLKFFKNDAEKRNFVLVGATAGIAAGLGAPIGGVLVGLESTTSFWNQDNVWKNLVASAACTLVIDVLLYHGTLSSGSLIGRYNLGAFNILTYEFSEVPIFILMGIAGGLIGALFNAVNGRINLFRLKYMPKWWHKLLEVIILSGSITTMKWLLLMNFCHCMPIKDDYFASSMTIGCRENEYNVIAALDIKRPGENIRWILLAPYGEIPAIILAMIGVFYFICIMLCVGTYQCLGLFYSVVLTGAAFGRILGEFLQDYTSLKIDSPSKYAFIGGAAILGGVLRAPLSFTVILLESNGIETPYVFALVATLQVAQLVGDFFNADLYDSYLRNTPMLPADAPSIFIHMKAIDVMNSPVLCFKTQEKASYINLVLNNCEYNGFPVVDDVDNDRSKGRLVGLILRSQIMVILINGYFKEREAAWLSTVKINPFHDFQFKHPFVNGLVTKISRRKHYTVDFTMFMNPCPIRVGMQKSVTSIFRTFRGLSLRHLIVVDENNKVVGIITRKDFIRHS